MATEYKGKLTAAQIDAIYDELEGKQNALAPSLSNNGNIVLMNLGAPGSATVFMPGTPSGDPMHYAYEAAGAVWNANTGFWEYRADEGGLTDLTNEDMRVCYSEAWLSSAIIPGVFFNVNGRTTINRAVWSTTADLANSFRGSNMEVAFVKGSGLDALPKNLLGSFWFCYKLRKIIGTIDMSYVTTAVEFRNSPLLEDISLKKLKVSVDLSHSPRISKASVRYMIQNAAPTSAITIKLATEAYLILASDRDIVNDLSFQPLITLVSA